MGDAPRPGDMGPIEQAQAYADGRSDDIARDVAAALLASHLAMQRAGSELPSVVTVGVHIGEAFADHQTINAGRVNAQAHRILDLFAPYFARLTQERDEARERARRVEVSHAEHAFQVIGERDALRQRAERAERELAVASECYVNEREEAAMLRARIAELEARSALGANDRGGYDQEQHPQNNYYDERADNIEPAADVAHLLRLFREARTVAVVGPYNPHTEAEKVERGERDGIRAVIAHLAAMGEEAWPTSLDVVRLRSLLDFMRTPLEPDETDALRARVAELEATLTEVEARAKAWEDTAREATTIGHGARDGIRMCAKELRKVLKRGAP